VLQETWLAWARRSGGGAQVDNSRAYPVRIAVNQALARRSAIERRQETYLGPWLPEPLVESPAEAQETAESVSFAMLVVLETLTPLERAVFVLGEVFGYPHTEIAGIVDRTPAAVRQLAHRPANTSRPGGRGSRPIPRCASRSPSGSWRRCSAVT
jgi:DNA-directed RNA polymerase specialized sigma24 family protein